MLSTWRHKPRSTVRDVISRPYQFWVLPAGFVLLGMYAVPKDIVRGEFGPLTVANLTVMAVIVLWLLLWLRRPTKDAV